MENLKGQRKQKKKMFPGLFSPPSSKDVAFEDTEREKKGQGKKEGGKKGREREGKKARK